MHGSVRSGGLDDGFALSFGGVRLQDVHRRNREGGCTQNDETDADEAGVRLTHGVVG